MDDISINTGKSRVFGTVDYVMFGLTLAISAAIGLYFAIRDRKKSSVKNFQLGGKEMGIFPVAMSFLVTFLSALSLLGNPVEVYNYNTMFWYLCVAFIFAMTIAGIIFVPFFYKLGLTSIFEYLELRFCKGVRVMASVLYIFQTMVYMSFVLYAPSLALTAVTSFDLWGCIVGIMLVVTLYTALGGMKAVVWTDTFQAVVIMAGLLAALIQGSIAVGGFDVAWKIAEQRDRIKFDDFSPDPKVRHSFWTVTIGGGIFWGSLYGVNQAQVQRAISLPTLRKSQLSLMVNLFGLILVTSVCFMIGIVMFAFYADCHPTLFKVIDKSDQLLPLFVMDILGNIQGIPGIFVSCIFSGSLSTLSSSLNALSAVTLEDFVKPYCIKNLTDVKAGIISKILVVIYGLSGIGFAWLVTRLGAILQASYSVYSIINGPIVGLFIIGCFFPCINKWGAYSGCITSLGMMSWIGFGAFVNSIRTPTSSFTVDGCNWNVTTTTTTTAASTMIPSTSTVFNISTEPSDMTSSDPFYEMYKLSYLWYAATGILVQVVVALVVSFCTGREKNVDHRLIIPIFDKIFPCLPKSFLKKLHCGVDHDKSFDLPISETKNEKEVGPGEVTDDVAVEFTKF